MPDIANLVEELSKLTVIEAADLVKQLETKWGVTAGQITFFVLLALPPFQNLVSDLVNQPRGKVLLGMTIGAVGVVLLQAIGTVVANLVWWKAHRDPA